MSRSPSSPRWFLAAALALLQVQSLSARAEVCSNADSLRQDFDIRVGLCSPTVSEIQATIQPDGAHLSWNAPSRSTTAYRSPVIAFCRKDTLGTCLRSSWVGVDAGQTVPGIEIRGTYLAVKDRRIQFDVLSITGGESDSLGVLGRETIAVSWLSIYEGSLAGSVNGKFVVTPQMVDQPQQFWREKEDVPIDTLALAGLRIVFHGGTSIAKGNAAVFDVEDFEGYHVWRWGANPLGDYQVIGEYSKLVGTAAPTNGWPGASPVARRFTFVDRDVFDGFTYHYAVTSYDQGFRRATSGTSLAQKFDSPVVPGGPTQMRLEFRRPPPGDFHPIIAVPNPFRDSAADPKREETNSVFFVNAPPRGTLYIYTMAGDLVLQREHTLPSVGTIAWDTCNGRGESVTSGVYIYKIVDLVSGQQSYGRLVIIR